MKEKINILLIDYDLLWDWDPRAMGFVCCHSIMEVLNLNAIAANASVEYGRGGVDY